MKKVLLVVIDALAARIAMPAMRNGRLKHFAELAERGALRDECVSIFPSITPAATAAIATGVYPVDHRIAGAFWYDRELDEVAYYGDDFWVVANRGINDFFHDFLVQLNYTRLQAPTIYQWAENAGLTSAVINFMWFRGDNEHAVNPPLMMKVLPGISRVSEVHGPQLMALADFASTKLPGTNRQWEATGGVSRRFGFHDDTTAEYLLQLTQANPFPDLTVAYFPNNDYVSHDEGPQAAERTLQAVDETLGEFIEKVGGIDSFLREFTLFVLGDHAQTDMVLNTEERGINMFENLSGFRCAKPGTSPEERDELIVCPNMRACHVYFRPRTSRLRDEVIERLLEDSRVDQVFYRDCGWSDDDSATDDADEWPWFQLATADRGRLRFRAAAAPHPSDDYGNHWEIDGDYAALDIHVNNGQIGYGEYPNAMERISTGFSPLADDLWVTARPGYEFQVPETSIHPGGSHGALNRDDSCTMLLTSGVPAEVEIPKIPRTIDIAPLILRSLGREDTAAELEASRHRDSCHASPHPGKVEAARSH